MKYGVVVDCAHLATESDATPILFDTREQAEAAVERWSAKTTNPDTQYGVVTVLPTGFGGRYTVVMTIAMHVFAKSDAKAAERARDIVIRQGLRVIGARVVQR